MKFLVAVVVVVVGVEIKGVRVETEIELLQIGVVSEVEEFNCMRELSALLLQ